MGYLCQVPLCKTILNSEDEYRKHVKITHNCTVCKKCLKIYKSPNARLSHEYVEHFHERYQCNVCNEHFKSASERSTHKKSCQGATFKKYICKDFDEDRHNDLIDEVTILYFNTKIFTFNTLVEAISKLNDAVRRANNLNNEDLGDQHDRNLGNANHPENQNDEVDGGRDVQDGETNDRNLANANNTENQNDEIDGAPDEAKPIGASGSFYYRIFTSVILSLYRTKIF